MAEHVQVRLFNRPGRLSSVLVPCIKAVDIFAVNGRHTGGVDRLFHPAFNFKGVDARIDQVRQNGEHAHVLHGERPDFPAAGVRTGGDPVPVQDPEGQPAGSRTAPPVAAPAAQKAGHETPARAGIAHGAVDKGLNLDLRILLPQGTEFLQGQLPGGNDAAHTVPAQVADRLRRGHRHLGAGVQGKSRTCLLQGRQNTGVLHNDPVQAAFEQCFHKADQIRQLLLPGQDIGRQVDFSAQDMGLSERQEYVFCGKVLSIGAGAELLPAQIDGIRAGVQGTGQSLSAARRCQKLHPAVCICRIRHVFLYNYSLKNQPFASAVSLFRSRIVQVISRRRSGPEDQFAALPARSDAASSFIWVATSSCLRSDRSCSRSSTAFCRRRISLFALK